MKAYKLTDQNGRTYNKIQWDVGVTHTAIGNGKSLCSNGWIHFYTNPLIALFMNPVHAQFYSPRLWEAESSGDELHEPLKSGCKTLRILKELPLPNITMENVAAFGILSGKCVYDKLNWNKWAENWLNGMDRTSTSANAAADAAAKAANAAYAFYADSNAANAAYAAAYAAANANAYATYASTYAVNAAAIAAAYAAANAADAAAKFDGRIDFIEIAKQAILIK